MKASSHTPFTTTRLIAATAVSAVAAFAASPALGQTTLIELDFTDGTTGTAYGADRFTDPLDGFKPRFTVADDAAGLGSGNALFVESSGGGAEWYVPFSVPAELVAGTTITYSFDVRMDSVNGPTSGSDQLYVGIYADADGSLGQTFNAGGVDDVDAVFGSEDGHFDFDTTGPIAPDFGMHSRIPTGSDAISVIRANARMRTENANQTGIMSGSGETVANPFSTSPDEDVAGLDASATTKQTFTGVWGLDDTGSEPMLTASYTMDDEVAGTSVSFANDDPLSDSDLATFDPTFHYIVFENIGDFDYVIDNLVVEFSGGDVGGLSADFNTDGIVDLLDLDILGANWQAAGTAATGDANGDGVVDLLDLDLLGAQWQQSGSFEAALAASGIAVPEPASMLLVAAGMGLIARRRR